MSDARRAVDRAADALRTAIVGGRFGVGDRLPPERQLAEQLEINRQTLRAALARLESEGLTRARQGSGITVQDWRETGGIGLLPHLVEAGRTDLLGDFLAMRRAIAVEAVAQASRRATDAELDELAVLADRLTAETDLAALAEGNLAFSRRVLRLAGNLPAELLFNTVAAVYRGSPAIRALLLDDPDGVRASFGAIVALLRLRRPEWAAQQVQQVLAHLDAHTLAKLEDPCA